MADQKVLEWLLEGEQPSIRYRTLTELMGRKESDPEVKEAKRNILKHGWAAEILSARRPGGGWTDAATQYLPKYTSTNWMMLVLADLGLTKKEPVIAELCEFWMEGFSATNGAVGGLSRRKPHYCVAGNMARALIQFGYGEDTRVRKTMEYFVSIADHNGGWSCFGSGRNLDSWEALSAFAVYPRSQWSPSMKDTVEKAAEFYLQRELHVQGDPYEPWMRFHYPAHYYYDVLVGLGFMTALGYGGDKRLGFALSLLKKKRRRDGRWILDALHPDVEGGAAAFYEKHPDHRPTPWGLEEPGRPSKMITLNALKILSNVGSSQ